MTPLSTHFDRSWLIGALSKQCASGEPFALMLVNLDRFRDHVAAFSVGEAHQAVLAAWQSVQATRQADQQFLAAELTADAARMPGDECALIQPGSMDRGALEPLAEQLLAAVRVGANGAGSAKVPRWTASVAIVRVAIGQSPGQVLRAAESALFQCKSQGGNAHWLVHAQSHKDCTDQADLARDLRAALAQGRVRAVYQPIIEIGTGRVVGLEALARWRHPTLGEVSPVRFVPMAEAYALVDQLGVCMVERVARDWAGWKTAALPLPGTVSINISRAHLVQPGVCQQLQDILAHHGVTPSEVRLEVTETLAMAGQEVQSALHTLRKGGFELSLDDFGTGHSSLSTLHTFPIHQIKIDRCFVSEVETSGYHRALVQAILSVAKSLGLNVVAEGVETEGQALTLLQLGCVKAQGWFYSRAVEAAALPALLTAGFVQALDVSAVDVSSVAGLVHTHQVVVTDAHGRVEAVNRAFCESTGYTMQEMRGRKPGELLQGPLSDPAAVERLRTAVALGQAVYGVELVNYRKDGSSYWTRIDLEPVRDFQGQVIRFVAMQTDITEQVQERQNAAQLAHTQSKLNLIKTSGYLGLWERDLVSGEGWVDDVARGMTGLKPNQPARTWAEMEQVLPDDSLAAFRVYQEEVMRGVTRGTVAYGVKMPDGSVNRLMTLWQRTDSRVSGIVVDVTQLYAVRDEAWLATHQLEAASGDALHYFWRLDCAAGRLHWTPQPDWANEVNVDGTVDQDLALHSVVPEDRPRVLLARQRALTETGMVETEYRMIRRDGALRHVLTRRTAVRNAAGQVTHVVGVLIDTTVQNEREAELRRAALRLNRVLKAAGVADFEFDGSLQQFRFSHRFAALYGLPEGASQLSWAEWLALVHPQDRASVQIGAEELLRSTQLAPRPSRFRIVRADTAEVRWVESRRVLELDAHGQLRLVVGVHRDVTDDPAASE